MTHPEYALDEDAPSLCPSCHSELNADGVCPLHGTPQTAAEDARETLRETLRGEL